MYADLKRQMKVLTAEKIYQFLDAQGLKEAELERLERDFCVDSHQYWPEDDQKKRQEIENQWQGISEQMETDMETCLLYTSRCV